MLAGEQKWLLHRFSHLRPGNACRRRRVDTPVRLLTKAQSCTVGGSVGARDGFAIVFSKCCPRDLSDPSVMIYSHIGSVKASRLGEAVGAR